MTYCSNPSLRTARMSRLNLLPNPLLTILSPSHVFRTYTDLKSTTKKQDEEGAKATEASGFCTPMVIKVGGTFTKNTTHIGSQKGVEVGRQEKPDSLAHIVCSQTPNEQDEEQQVGKWNSHVKHLHVKEKKKTASLAQIDR